MKLTYSCLCSLHKQLSSRLRQGQLSIEEYVSEWDRLIEFAGWTWSDVARCIDDGWSQTLVVTDAFMC